MFGFPRLKALVGEHPGGEEMIEFLLRQLGDFTGAGWEQEDDVTFLVLTRLERNMPDPTHPTNRQIPKTALPGPWEVLAEFSMPSAQGNERQVMNQVAQAVSPLKISRTRLERLKTAVAEATMNAMEHGNHYREDQPVFVRVQASQEAISVAITDHGSGEQIPQAETPDIEAKLSGVQTPRGWGLFLIKNMVDEMNVNTDENHHTVELILNREGE
jgi:anti-sigma regulatory factor (Ser/Thr protein kinase)